MSAHNEAPRRVSRRWIIGGLATLSLVGAAFLLFIWLNGRSERARDAAQQSETQTLLSIEAKYRLSPSDLARRRKLIQIFRETEGAVSNDAFYRHQLAEQVLSEEYPFALEKEKQREAAASAQAMDQEVNAMLANEM